MTKCLYCYKETENGKDFHDRCVKQFFGTTEVPVLPYTLAEISELAKEVIERSVSVPGVQAKLSLTILKKTQNNPQSRLNVVGALGGNYIFKPATSDYPHMPENEHVTMRMAELFGIPVVPSSLIKLQSGELSYITKRIDRTIKGDKIHMLDMFQILEAFDKYKSSMEKVGKAILSYSSNTLLDAHTLFELTLFSFLTGNNDMHLKNFSLIHSTLEWTLAPAYDLLNVAILLPNDTEELALTLGGKKSKLTKQQFVVFGKGMGLSDKQIDTTFSRFISKKEKAIELLKESFLPNDFQDKYCLILNERYFTIA
jgi:serine/threonine-protein kinase HipA